MTEIIVGISIVMDIILIFTIIKGIGELKESNKPKFVTYPESQDIVIMWWNSISSEAKNSLIFCYGKDEITVETMTYPEELEIYNWFHNKTN